MARQTKIERRSRYRTLRRGVKKHYQGGGPIHVGGTLYTPAQIADLLQSLLDAIAATNAARVHHQTLVIKQDKLEKSLRSFVRMLGETVYARFGSSAAELADFGLPSRKKTGPRTVAAKVEMVKKAKATRVARGTMGKRQRQKIKGKA